MAKQPPLLNPGCSGGDQIQPASRRTPHRPLRTGAPTSLASPFQSPHSDEGGSCPASTPWGPSLSPYSPSSFANRSPHCMLVRGSSLVSKTSSGYFSFEVSPALVYCDKATQTPSPPCQAFNHYLSIMAARNIIDHEEVRPEILIARELRRIGDEFHALYNPLEGFHNNRHGIVDNPQVIILRVLHFIIRLIWRMQWLRLSSSEGRMSSQMADSSPWHMFIYYAIHIICRALALFLMLINLQDEEREPQILDQTCWYQNGLAFLSWIKLFFFCNFIEKYTFLYFM